MTDVDGPKGKARWERVDRALPGGGIYLSRSARFAGPGVQPGPPAMPALLFENDPQLETGRRFSREAALRGALFHPNLNWFLNAAHDDAAIDEAVEIADEAFRAIRLS